VRVVALLTEWDEFRWLEFAKVASSWMPLPSSTPATSSTRLPCGGSASPTAGSAAREGRGGRRCGLPRSHLCDALVARGDEVLAIDDLSTGRTANVAHLGDNPAFELVVGDVSTGVDVSGSVGAVAHLASPASPPAYLARPLGTLAVGSEGRGTCSNWPVATGALPPGVDERDLRRPGGAPQTEDYRGNVDPIGPRSVYDEAKRFAEALTSAHRRTLGTDTAIVRIFNTYGPRLSPGDGRWCRTSSSRPWPASRSPSTATAPDALVVLRRRRDRRSARPARLGPGRPGQHRQPRRAHYQRDRGRGAEGHRVGFARRPPAAPTDDPTRRCPDITLASERLGWSPRVDSSPARADCGILRRMTADEGRAGG